MIKTKTTIFDNYFKFETIGCTFKLIYIFAIKTNTACCMINFEILTNVLPNIICYLLFN